MVEHGLLARHCRAAVRRPGARRRAGGSRAASVLPSRGAFPGRNDAVSEARALTPCPRRGREITMIRRFTRISPDRAQPRDWLACPVKSLSVRSPRPNLHASRFHLDVLHGAAPSVPDPPAPPPRPPPAQDASLSHPSPLRPPD